jgi:peptidoglycan/LPS O-acetylase OafA/YrhL
MTLARSGYFPQIDSLRALTIITVIVYHIDATWIPGGFAAVDVFFTISGYVISRSMLDLNARRFSTFVSDFYAKRMLRIVPALLVILLVTSVATTLFVPPSWLSSANYITASYAFWGSGNYGLLHSGDAYFAPRIDFNPYAHTSMRHTGI